MPRPIYVVLAYYHEAREDQQSQEEKKEPVLPQQPHRHSLCQGGSMWCKLLVTNQSPCSSSFRREKLKWAFYLKLGGHSADRFGKGAVEVPGTVMDHTLKPQVPL